MVVYVIVFYVSFHAEAQHLTSTSLAFYLVHIFNGASKLGRAIPNALADKIGSFDILAPSTVLLGKLELCMITVHSESSVIIIAILLGFASGVLIGIVPLCLANLTEDKSKLGIRMGMAYAMISVSALASGPGAGAILGQGVSLL